MVCMEDMRCSGIHKRERAGSERRVFRYNLSSDPQPRDGTSLLPPNSTPGGGHGSFGGGHRLYLVPFAIRFL